MRTETYINDMSRSGTWGDELTLRAMSDALGVVINVITSEKKHWYIQYWPTDEIKETSDVFVTYISPVHYNAINRKRTLARSVQEDERSDSGIATASTASGSDAPRSPCMPKQGRTLSWLSRRSMRQSS